MSEKNQAQQKKLIIGLVGLCAVLMLLLLLSQQSVRKFLGLADPENLVSDFSVHFIDVGQGDSTLIISDKMNILIDAGEYNYGDAVVKYLKGINVHHLDIVIVTHPHSDHIGGMGTVISEMEVGKILMMRLPEDMVPVTKVYANFFDVVKRKELKITAAKPGTYYELGRGVLQILGPVNLYDDLNNNSIVAKFTYDNKFSLLLTGDMEKEAEKDLIDSNVNLDSDMLKVGHHGSNTSTHKAFLDEVSPDYAAISVKDKNNYKHPSEKVIKRLEDIEAEIYRTDHDGNIVVQISGNRLWIETKK